MSPLAGRRVLLTGAAGGIGCEVARGLVSKGAGVLLVGRKLEPLQALAKELDQPFQVCDLVKPKDRDALIDRVDGCFGTLDGLVHCAGVNAFGLHDSQSDMQIEEIIGINLVAPIQLTRALLPLLESGRKPVIVCLGSVFAHIGFPGFSLYSASKFGLLGYTEALRRECSDGPVRVAWVAPRATRTRMNNGVIDQLNAELKTNYDSPKMVASAIIAAVGRPVRSRILGIPERFFARVNQFFPALVDGALAKQLPVIRKHNSRQKEIQT